MHIALRAHTYLILYYLPNLLNKTPYTPYIGHPIQISLDYNES